MLTEEDVDQDIITYISNTQGEPTQPWKLDTKDTHPDPVRQGRGGFQKEVTSVL
jgi:hypothetical protein